MDCAAGPVTRIFASGLSGRMPPSFLSRVMDSRAACRATSADASVAKRARSVASGKGRSNSPSSSLSVRMRRTDWSMRLSAIVPSRTSSISASVKRKSLGVMLMSTPASIAIRTASLMVGATRWRVWR